MEKVFIVTSGSYSDYNIDAVFDTKEKAEAYIKSFGQYDQDFNDIEEYDLNPKTRTRGRKGMFAYHVRMTEALEVKSCFSGESYEDLADNKECFYTEYYKPFMLDCYVWARDKEHAIKIAVDKAREIKATVGWGNLTS